MSENESAVPPPGASGSPVVDTLSNGVKVKVRVLRMRACDERDEKNKICAGHLKRWYFFDEEFAGKYGTGAEVYRCEHCKTLYLPNPKEAPRTRTLAY